MTITVIAKIKAKPGSEKQVEDAFRAMITKVREEPGCLAYTLHRSSQDGTVFVFYETYKDREALDAHGKTAHMADLNGKLRGHVDGRAQVDILEELARK